jgi:hypothetical protein
MTVDDAINIAVFVLHHSGGVTSLTAGEIVSNALDPNLRSFWTQAGIDLPWLESEDNSSFAAQLAKRLRAHVDGTGAGSRIVDGTRNGWKLGHRAGVRLSAFVPSLRVPSSSQHLGLAGEYAVMSELLALDWSVAKPPFDNGVDLFATKNGLVRTVQVKTAKLTNLGDGVMSFSGSLDSHNLYDNNSHYYVLVFRLIAGTRWLNTFYVCRSTAFTQLLTSLGKMDREKSKWVLPVNRVNGRFVVAGSKDITDDMDRLESRFE